MEAIVSERFYSITEFSQKYCTCRSRVYEMLAQGELTAVKVGRSTRITEEAAEAWKASLSPYAPKSSLTKSTSHSNGADKR
jgi:excisionase family DNA binding protein